MAHFAPSNNIFMIDGHHAHRSPEYQGTSYQWKGTFAKLEFACHVNFLSDFWTLCLLYFIVLIGVSSFNGWFC